MPYCSHCFRRSHCKIFFTFTLVLTSKSLQICVTIGLITSQKKNMCEKVSRGAENFFAALQKVQVGSISRLNLLTLWFNPRILLHCLNRNTLKRLLPPMAFQSEKISLALISDNSSFSVYLQ